MKAIAAAFVTLMSFIGVQCGNPTNEADGREFVTGGVYFTELQLEQGIMNIYPPMKLNIILDPGKSLKQMREDCNWYGGQELLYYPKNQVWVCEEIDY